MFASHILPLLVNILVLNNRLLTRESISHLRKEVVILMYSYLWLRIKWYTSVMLLVLRTDQTLLWSIREWAFLLMISTCGWFLNSHIWNNLLLFSLTLLDTLKLWFLILWPGIIKDILLDELKELLIAFMCKSIGKVKVNLILVGMWIQYDVLVVLHELAMLSRFSHQILIRYLSLNYRRILFSLNV